jgi:hypothetical protein
MQNLVPSGVSASQCGQPMGELSGPARNAARAWMGRSPNAHPDRHAMDGVSVLHAQPHVKRKARDDGNGGREGRKHGHDRPCWVSCSR